MFMFAPRALREAEQSTSQLLSQGGSGGGGALMAPGCGVLPGAASQITAWWTWKESQMKHQGITPCPPHLIPPRPLEERWSSDRPHPTDGEPTGLPFLGDFSDCFLTLPSPSQSKPRKVVHNKNSSSQVLNPYQLLGRV